MAYSLVRKRFEAHPIGDVLGDIPRLNECVLYCARSGRGTSSYDVEALLFDCCSEYVEMPAYDRASVCAHTASLGMVTRPSPRKRFRNDSSNYLGQEEACIPCSGGVLS